MHFEQTQYVKEALAKYFAGINKDISEIKVLEIGSKDINGNNRQFLDSRVQYTGLDLSAGKNVDIVSHFVDYFKDKECAYDLIISTEALEHDKRWFETLQAIASNNKEDWTAIITAAGMDRKEHGTSRSLPGDSPDTNDYYGNISYGKVYNALKGYDIGIEDVVESNKDIYFTLVKNKLYSSKEILNNKRRKLDESIAKVFSFFLYNEKNSIGNSLQSIKGLCDKLENSKCKKSTIVVEMDNNAISLLLSVYLLSALDRSNHIIINILPETNLPFLQHEKTKLRLEFTKLLLQYAEPERFTIADFSNPKNTYTELLKSSLSLDSNILLCKNLKGTDKLAIFKSADIIHV